MIPVMVGALVLALASPALGQSEASTHFEQQLSAIFAQKGLTSVDASQRAVASSYDLRGRHEQVLAARTAVRQAFLGFLPRLTLMGRYSRKSPVTPSITGRIVVARNAADGPLPTGTTLVQVPIDSFPFGVPVDEYFGVASINIPLTDYIWKLTQTYQAAQHNEHAIQLSAVAERLKVARDARILYYSWVDSKLKLVAAEQALENVRGQATDVGRFFDVGRASQADVANLKGRAASAELVIQKIRDLVTATEQELRTAMHLSAEQIMLVGEDVRQMPNLPPGLDNIGSLYEEAVQQRLELRSMNAIREAVKSQASASRGGMLPRIEATGSAIYANPNPRYFPSEPVFRGTWEIGVQLSWSPNDVANAFMSGRSLDARARELETQEASFRDVLRTAVTRAWLSFRQSLTAVETAKSEMEAAEEAYCVRQAMFQVGRATSVELIDAETSLTRARIELINACIGTRISLVELLYIIGRDVA